MPDWIPWTKGLPLKREVVMMGRALSLDRQRIACHCMAVWEWADENTADGNAPGVPSTFLDELTSVPSFGQAMLDVGWLAEDANGIIFPNWDRWNTHSAKVRAQNRERKRKERERKKAADGAGDE